MTHDEIHVEILVHRSTGTVHAWPRDREFRFLTVFEENDILYGVHDFEEIDEMDSGQRYEPISKNRVSGFTVRDRSHHTTRPSLRTHRN